MTPVFTVVIPPMIPLQFSVELQTWDPRHFSEAGSLILNKINIHDAFFHHFYLN